MAQRKNNKESQAQLAARLREEIKHWQQKVKTLLWLIFYLFQSVDLNLDLEVAKAEQENVAVNLQNERGELMSELTSVKNTLASLTSTNKSLKSGIQQKERTVDAQNQQIAH